MRVTRIDVIWREVMSAGVIEGGGIIAREARLRHPVSGAVTRSIDKTSRCPNNLIKRNKYFDLTDFRRMGTGPPERDGP